MRIFLEIFWIFLEIFKILMDFFGGIFLEIFREFFQRIFLEEFFGRKFLGGLLGGFFWEEFFFYIGIDLFVKILSQWRRGQEFRSLEVRSATQARRT